MNGEWKLIYERRAWDELQGLDEDARCHLTEALEAFASTGVGHTRKLEARFPPVFRLRWGNFRALFVYELHADGVSAIVVKRIGDRKDAY